MVSFVSKTTYLYSQELWFSRPCFATGLAYTTHSSKKIMQTFEHNRKDNYIGSTLIITIFLKKHFKRKPLARSITVQINRNERQFPDSYETNRACQFFRKTERWCIGVTNALSVQTVTSCFPTTSPLTDTD
jgi:hypothetical protein